MNRWKLLLVATVLVASWQPSDAAPIVFEISTLITTLHTIPAPCGTNDPSNSEFCEHWDSQIGDTAQFRVLLDTERYAPAPPGIPIRTLGGPDSFYAELIGINFDGFWIETSVLGAGYQYPPCASNPNYGDSTWYCSGFHVGYWTFFSGAPSIEEWLDPSYDRHYCNAFGRPGSDNWMYCDLGGNGTMTDIRRVPEPGSLLLVGLGLVGLGLGRRRGEKPLR